MPIAEIGTCPGIKENNVICKQGIGVRAMFSNVGKICSKFKYSLNSYPFKKKHLLISGIQHNFRFSSS